MKSYLSLIPISAKVRKRQNRMTILCILMSVLLITTVFSLADMATRSETIAMQKKHGNWHLKIENISQKITEEIGLDPDITNIGQKASFNENADQPYYIGEKRAVLCGTDTEYITELTNSIEEGSFPQRDNEVMLSSNAKLAFDVDIGDTIALHTPSGDTDFYITGFGSDDAEYYQGQTFLVGVYMTYPAFNSIMEQNNISADLSCYLKFRTAAQAAEAKKEFPSLYNIKEESIGENTGVMGLSGQSSNKSMQNFLILAVALFVMVLIAGVLMISGSMNSSISRRMKFFGMLRCIGASRQQIIRFVRLEALNWCKTAVPAGIIIGAVLNCGICAAMRYGIGGEFADMPVFALSPIGIISGGAAGVITVFLAAQAPAKKAAKVSPVSAVSGNALTTDTIKHGTNLNFGRVEISLGVHHASNSKKNLFLMTASFSLSIILCLCFSVGLDFAKALLPSSRSWTPDIVLNGYSNATVIDKKVTEELGRISGVEQFFACSYKDNIPATSSGKEIDHINLLSYDEFMFENAKDSIIEGNLSDVCGKSDKVMIVRNKDNPLSMGDIITINNRKFEVSCTVSNSLYPSEYLVICSQETFEQLIGSDGYSFVGIQVENNVSDETLRAISSLAASDVIFSDSRESNRQNNTTFLALKFLMYGFLIIIALITMFYIINSISMSTLARIKQYGSMRAVGMDGRQLTRMIASEALTYAVSGLVFGCGIGLPLSRFIHIRFLTKYCGLEWHLPVVLLGIITAFVLISVLIAVYKPSKRICNTPITETINEL